METGKLSPTAQRLKDQAAQRSFEQGKKESQTTVASVTRELSITVKFLKSFGSVLWWIWLHILSPFAIVFSWPIIKWFVGKYIGAWNAWTRYKDEFGNDKFSRKKGIAMVLGTILAIYGGFNGALLAYDTGIYSVTREEKAVYLSQPLEIFPGANIFSVQGCLINEEDANTGVAHCNPDEALYYRVRPTLFNELWSLGNGHGLFFPELIVAPVGASWSKCQIVSYNFRFKWLMGLGDMYPDLLDLKCERATT